MGHPIYGDLGPCTSPACEGQATEWRASGSLCAKCAATARLAKAKGGRSNAEFKGDSSWDSWHRGVREAERRCLALGIDPETVAPQWP